MTRPASLSRSAEDYLKAIYSLSDQGEPASTSAIAEALDVQPASVTGMVKRLAEGGLLAHVPYRGVLLTERGTREALSVIRRHRILETYLHLRLGYSWDDVHREAERLEHAASDELINRMAEALKNPSYDPHGAPIPTQTGEVESRSAITLDTVESGTEVSIQAVSDDDDEGLRRMEAKGLLPGVDLLVEGQSSPSEPINVRVGGPDGHQESVPSELARQIFVVSAP